MSMGKHYLVTILVLHFVQRGRLVSYQQVSGRGSKRNILIALESHNHSFWKEPWEVFQPGFLLKAGSTFEFRPDCLALSPGKSWKPPRMEFLHPLWSNCLIILLWKWLFFTFSLNLQVSIHHFLLFSHGTLYVQIKIIVIHKYNDFKINK